ncbi:MAG: PepSY domain-containing protein [Mogibacterium sp.]|nr:PepSY domain-containing protein [Mogibacterium sp.]
MKKTAKIFRIALALIMVLAMSSSVFAADIGIEAAKRKALKNAGVSRTSITRLSAKNDDGVYEIKFRKKKGGAKYSYDIASDGTILEKSIDYRYRRNYSRYRIGRNRAQQIAAKKAKVKLSKVKRGSCSFDYDDGMGKYEIKFRSGKRKYDIDILAATGEVTDYNWELRNRELYETDNDADYSDEMDD